MLLPKLSATIISIATNGSFCSNTSIHSFVAVASPMHSCNTYFLSTMCTGNNRQQQGYLMQVSIYSVKNLTMKRRTKAALAAAADSVWDIKMQTGKRFAAHATYLLVPSLYQYHGAPHRPHRRTPPSTLLASTFNLQNLWSLKNKKFMFNFKYDDNNVLPSHPSFSSLCIFIMTSASPMCTDFLRKRKHTTYTYPVKCVIYLTGLIDDMQPHPLM